MAITAWSAIWFLPFALPIAVWVAWNDMKYMKIPNRAVMALIVVFLVVGLIAVPFPEYFWRLLHFVVILAIGFGLNMIGAIGAGDAKFAAAMAPFIALGDLPNLLYLFAAVLVAAVVTHRVSRKNWESWTHKGFPMGLALGGALVFYLIGGAVLGA